MIARTDNFTDRSDVWARLSAALPSGVISWRQDGKPTARDGRHYARFVCYIEANTVRERLDSVVPGEWDLTLELLPQTGNESGDNDASCAFKARLQVLGVIREDVGTGRDYKSASTDAFKRAAVRFGIAHELYAYEQNWVEVDGDGKYAKPMEDPAQAYAKRYGVGAAASSRMPSGAGVVTAANGSQGETGSVLTDVDSVSCPKCGGRVWDNRLTKRNPKAPDYKCRNRSCDGVIWPARLSDEDGTVAVKPAKGSAREAALVGVDAEEDEIPF